MFCAHFLIFSSEHARVRVEILQALGRDGCAHHLALFAFGVSRLLHNLLVHDRVGQHHQRVLARERVRNQHEGGAAQRGTHHDEPLDQSRHLARSTEDLATHHALHAGVVTLQL